jgi:hypothetical protein
MADQGLARSENKGRTYQKRRFYGDEILSSDVPILGDRLSLTRLS